MDTRKKILFVITKSNWGGAQRYVYDIAANLPRDRFEAVVAGGGDGALFAKLRTAGIRTISVPGLQRDVGIASEWRAFLHIFLLLKKERPDIAHLNSSKTGALGAIAVFIFKLLNFFPTGKRGFQLGNPVSQSGPSVIFTAHGWGFHEDRSRLARAAIFLVSWFSSLFQDKIIVLNTADLAVAEKFIPRRKLALIPNGIADIDFHARADARAFLAKKIGRPIADDTILIGAVAELTRNKGLTHLVAAFSRLSKSDFNTYGSPTSIVLLIIGEGEDRAALEKQISDAGLTTRVFLAGFIPHAARLMTGFDIFILPSLKEGLPYVVMEAMSAGRAVIATRVGGIPDFIKENETGFLIPPKDSQKLSKSLEHLMRHPEEWIRLGNNAAARIKTKFSFSDMMERTVALYAPKNK